MRLEEENYWLRSLLFVQEQTLPWPIYSRIERRILAALFRGPRTVSDLVEVAYRDRPEPSDPKTAVQQALVRLRKKVPFHIVNHGKSRHAEGVYELDPHPRKIRLLYLQNSVAISSV